MYQGRGTDHESRGLKHVFARCFLLHQFQGILVRDEQTNVTTQEHSLCIRCRCKETVFVKGFETCYV